MLLFNRVNLPKVFSFILLILCLALAPSPVHLAESEDVAAEWDCHVERVVYNAGGKVHAEHQASSNAGYPHVSNVPHEEVNIELHFTEGMDLGSFHGTTVTLRHRDTGQTVNVTFSGGNDADKDGHPEQVVVDVEGLQKDNHYMLIVNGRDMVQSEQEAVWGAPDTSGNRVMPYTLQLPFDTNVAYASPATDTESSRTFFNP